MNDSIPSILITGANGFVGSRLCRKFIDEGFHVVAGVRKSSDLTQLEGLKVEYRFGDVTQPDSLPEMVQGVDYIIHNAGLVKAKKKQRFFDVNQTGTENLFRAIDEHNAVIKKAIYISSLAAAGPSQKGKPVTEDDTPHPITTYGRSKLAGEKAALSFADRFNVLSVRPPAIYGPGDKEIFPFFDAVYKGIRPFIGRSNRKLQLIAVDDLCRALMLAVTHDTPTGAVCFVAEDKAYTMKELIGLLSEGCNKDGFRLYIPSSLLYVTAYFTQVVSKLVNATPMLTVEKAREMLSSWEVSTDLARKLFDFKSEISFEKGARVTYDWYLEKGWLK